MRFDRFRVGARNPRVVAHQAISSMLSATILAVFIGVSSSASSPPPPALPYQLVPRIYTTNPEAFRNTLLDPHAEATRIAFFGDSTSLDNLGVGSEHMNWRRWLWHQHFGHTPGTQLSRSSNFGSVPSAEWMLMGGVSIPEPCRVPDTYLPAGHHNAASAGASFIRSPFNGGGLILRLNHRNDNHLSHDCPFDLGFYYVEEAVGLGEPQYASAGLEGGVSQIDCAAGLRVEVVAATHANSEPIVRWELVPQDTSSFCYTDLFAPITQSGTMFGGDASLNAPVGGAHREISETLIGLTGTQGYYMVEVAGDTFAPDQSAQNIGARFVSNNSRGLICDSLSSGGYGSSSYLLNHAQSGPVLAAAGYKVAWIMYGINDQSLKHTSEVYESHIRDLIAFLRVHLGKDLPIIVETNTYKHAETDYGKHYAGALYRIAQDTPNTLLINSRRIIEERFGWGSGSEQSHLFDGIHFTNLGAECVSRASVETLLEHLTGVIANKKFLRQPKGEIGRDTTLRSAAPTTGFGDSPLLEVAAGPGHATKTLINFDDCGTIPYGSTIVSAQLQLTVIEPSVHPSTMTISRLLSPWVEGTPQTSGATWLHSGFLPWLAAGGDSSSREQIPGLILPSWPRSAAGDRILFNVASLVQDALDLRQGVLSLMLEAKLPPFPVGGTATATFHSSDVATATDRPLLSIVYLEPGGSPQGCFEDCAPQPGNGIVNVDDLLTVINSWGMTDGDGDVAPKGGDGIVNVDDLLAVINAWGPCLQGN